MAWDCAGRGELSKKILTGKYAAPEHMSDSMKDIVAGMLTLDPSQRLSLSSLWSHRWVTGSLVSRSFSLPAALLPIDRTTHEYIFDDGILDHMSRMGVDKIAVVSDLHSGECNRITATYFLLAEALRDSGTLPPVTPAVRALGSSLVKCARNAQRQHGFSLDIDDAGDRDDQSHFAPSRSKK
jgi:serine/threonine protein kinase